MSPGPHVAFQRRPSTRDAGARAQAGSSTNQALAARGGTLASDPHAALCPGPEPPLDRALGSRAHGPGLVQPAALASFPLGRCRPGACP